MQIKHIPSHIIKIQGQDQSGPDILILGGTHGDEDAGIAVVEYILNEFNLDRTQLNSEKGSVIENDHISGNLYLGYGNPAAIEKHTRSASDEINLNRSFIREELDRPPNPNDREDLKRARELITLLKNIDYLFDIHSTSSPSEPFIITTPQFTPQHFDIVTYLAVTKLIQDPASVYVSDLDIPINGSTDQYVNEHGKGIGVCYETGWEQDLDQTEKIANNLLELIHYLLKVGPKPTKMYDKKLFQITDCIIAQEDLLTYADGLNESWQHIKNDQLIGTYESGKEERATKDGIYVFPTGEHKIKKGLSLYYLVEEISPTL